MIVQKEGDRRMLKSENVQNHGVGENDFGSVSFAIKLEGIKQGFGNFHYYRQCVIDDVTPLIAPNAPITTSPFPFTAIQCSSLC